jgi:hypothetical protein
VINQSIDETMAGLPLWWMWNLARIDYSTFASMPLWMTDDNVYRIPAMSLHETISGHCEELYDK